MTESKAGTVELEARSLTEARPSAAMPVVESVRPILWDRTHLRLLDQRLLPAEVRYLDCRGANDVADAIHGMAVCGAPAIGIAAAYGLVLALRSDVDSLPQACEPLLSSRPNDRRRPPLKCSP